MVIAKIKVDGVTAVATELSQIPKGIQGATIEVTYDGAWKNLNKTAVFSGSVVKDVVNAGAVISVPPETVAKSGHRLRVGFYGVDGENKVIIPTLWVDLGAIQSAADPSGDASTNPSLPVWAQLQAEVEALKEAGGGAGTGATAEQAAQITQNKEDIENLSKEKLDASKLPEAVKESVDAFGAVSYNEQNPTEEQKAQARKNIGADGTLVSILESDPAEPQEGMLWILKSSVDKLTTPVIELGDVSENSIAIKLSNASFDGSGAVVTTYNIYVNGELNKTENIAAGGTCIITGLSAETEYQISVRGVKGAVLSVMSNTLTATTLEAPDVPDEPEQEFVIVPRFAVQQINGVTGVQIGSYPSRAVCVATQGDIKLHDAIETADYFLINVPKNATSCTVVCPGLMFGFSGWNKKENGLVSYDVDSGWIASGTTYTFGASAAEYANFAFKKGSAGTEEFTENDEVLVGITITFA